MSSAKPTPWTGNWWQRIGDRLKNLGFDSCAQFLEAREGQSFSRLAAELGSDQSDVAPMQLESYYLQESRNRGRLIDAGAELLARQIAERFPKGWGSGVRVEYRKASVLAGWITTMLLDLEQNELSKTHLQAIADAVSHAAPIGWIPKNGMDPILRQAFAEVTCERPTK